MNIREQILKQLEELEAEHHIHIPIAVESGSRAWGFASHDSDSNRKLKKLEASKQLLEDLHTGAQSGEQEGWISVENMEAFFDGKED